MSTQRLYHSMPEMASQTTTWQNFGPETMTAEAHMLASIPSIETESVAQQSTPVWFEPAFFKTLEHVQANIGWLDLQVPDPNKDDQGKASSSVDPSADMSCLPFAIPTSDLMEFHGKDKWIQKRSSSVPPSFSLPHYPGGNDPGPQEQGVALAPPSLVHESLESWTTTVLEHPQPYSCPSSPQRHAAGAPSVLRPVFLLPSAQVQTSTGDPTSPFQRDHVGVLSERRERIGNQSCSKPVASSINARVPHGARWLPPGAKVTGFIRKLQGILGNTGYRDIVFWSSSRRRIVIQDVKRFTDEVLSTFFGQSSFGSFVRQLNRYGFSKARHNEHRSTVSDGNHCEFEQPHFTLAAEKRDVQSQGEALAALLPRSNISDNIQRVARAGQARSELWTEINHLQLSQDRTQKQLSALTRQCKQTVELIRGLSAHGHVHKQRQQALARLLLRIGCRAESSRRSSKVFGERSPN